MDTECSTLATYLVPLPVQMQVKMLISRNFFPATANDPDKFPWTWLITLAMIFGALVFVLGGKLVPAKQRAN